MAIASFRHISILCLFLILVSRCTSQSDYPEDYCFTSYGTYAPNSTYQFNLNILLSKLTSNPNVNYGFYNLSYGQSPDTVYGIGLCRGDVTPSTCRACLRNSTTITQSCDKYTTAIAIHDECLLFYSDYVIFGVVPTLDFTIYNRSVTDNITDWEQYKQVLNGLLGSLTRQAASGDSRWKFAAGNTDAGSSRRKIYGVAQCMPDLNEPECRNCLDGAISRIPECCKGSTGGRVVKPSCSIRFESHRFYEIAADVPISVSVSAPAPAPAPLLSAPSVNITTSQGKHNKSRLFIEITAPVVGFVVLLSLIGIYVARGWKLRTAFHSKCTYRSNDELEADAEIEPVASMQFSFDTIKVATNSFSDANKLGQGGFGPVYKGRLSSGQNIAAKRLSGVSGQGDTEFKNEVLLMAKLQHRNLVRLLGFCLEEKERLLIYELLPNRSLDHFVFDPFKCVCLDWEARFKIIEGITCELNYLHEKSQQRIIYRNLKTNNILLDINMNPKILDFGMVKLFAIDESQAKTNRIVGTLGYMAPKYAKHGRFSVKSDVFSFGVLILEIVRGQKNGGIHDEENIDHLPSFAWKSWRKGTSSNIVDSTLSDGSRSEIMRCIHIGLLCVQERAANRPTMASVLLMLDSDSFSLPEPLQPAFFMNNKSLSHIKSEEYNSVSASSSEQNSKTAEILSVDEASITKLYPR
ncbi:cysteine-rich receptor-like protein kinase 29 [Prosopis cineraria]|uniref:cysteine-rich receptor-like protein kinase 29 n=1 Tax=Prosopis cineraria TaxID=364024 RepID=UPI0024108DEF|nr:cysteine-rich receptor-like protein kinase 29 [Prosopis cineraria]